MDIGLIDVDSHNFPNLALMKISAYHKSRGDNVEWALPIRHYDIVYQSKVFDDTYSSDIDWIPNADMIVKGGTGYDLHNKLPYEIEHIMPDYQLYGINDTAYGFLTRGCPRNDKFCIVPQKEGRCSIKVADLREFWDGQKNVVLMDPNLLACRDRDELLDQLIESRAIVDFTQGLDIRYTTPLIAYKLGQMRVKALHFAWDNPRENLEPYFRHFGEWYRRKASSRKRVYVLVNYDSSMDENLRRIYTLRDLGYDPDVRIYDKPNAPIEVRQLQRWCNNKYVFGKCRRFEDYVPYIKANRMKQIEEI